MLNTLIPMFAFMTVSMSSGQCTPDTVAPETVEPTAKFHPFKLLKHVILFPVDAAKGYTKEVERIIYLKYKYSG